MLRRDVIAVRAQPTEIGGSGPDQIDPPVRQVRRNLDADTGHQPPRLRHQALHVLERHRRGPLRRVELRAASHPRAPVIARRRVGDLRRLAPVIALMRHEVLEDHLLQMAVALVQSRQHLEGLDPLLLALADPDQDPARERDPQLPRRRDRLDPSLRRLRRRTLMHDQIRIHRLEHQPLRSRHLTQPQQVRAIQHTEIRVRQQAALERPLARPHHVRREVLEPKRRQQLAHPRVDLRLLPRQHEQLLDPTLRHRLVEDPLHLLGRMQMRPVRRERAVLAIAAARPRERQA